MSDVIQLLSRVGAGDSKASDELLTVVYDELRQLAAQRLRYEQPGHTLQATALVHEAYLRLVSVDCDQVWSTRGHFFAAAAEAMRRILVERARKRSRLKHGGGLQRVDFETLEVAERATDDELLLLDEALSRFGRDHPEKARLIELRFFVGLTIEESARALGISEATAKRHWRFARAWLHREIAGRT